MYQFFYPNYLSRYQCLDKATFTVEGFDNHLRVTGFDSSSFCCGLNFKSLYLFIWCFFNDNGLIERVLSTIFYFYCILLKSLLLLKILRF